MINWLNGDNLVAGCMDHAIKIVDVENSHSVKQSILMEHKVATCMDTSQDYLVLTGSEDSQIRLWDTRSGSQKPARRLANTYQGHQKWIT